MTQPAQRKNHPQHALILRMAILGIGLLVLGQTLTLVHLRPLSEYWYGIVWTGFILAVDALLAWRTGASLLLDRPREFLRMVMVSACGWWLFELANVLLLDSWSYSPSPDVPRWVQALRSTYFFATLVPATLQATLLALHVARTKPSNVALAQPMRTRIALPALLVGVIFAALAIVFPVFSLPLLLIALGFVVDAVNLLRGQTSLLAHLRAKAFGLPLAIMFGNIAAGVLGEMWNYPAAPKWTYRVPYADTVRLFEMPLPGYLGYAALALDLFVLVHLVRPVKSHAPGLPEDHPLVVAGLD